MTRNKLEAIIQALIHLRESATDENALQAIDIYPKWKSDVVYSTGNRVSLEDILYKCLQEHTSQESWKPDVSPSLWVRVDNPSIEWPEWIQPVGSTDAYPIGAKVSHNEKHWTSDYANNIWEPGVYGWTEVS